MRGGVGSITTDSRIHSFPVGQILLRFLLCRPSDQAVQGPCGHELHIGETDVKGEAPQA